jgi:anaerobic selenocysteine-containing dehydrogenase
MTPVRTVCARDCYDSCGLIVQTNEAGLMQPAVGDPLHPVTRGFTCPRGRKDHKRLIENRVPSPHLRRGGRLAPAAWESALEEVAGRLRHTLERWGPEAVLYLNYAGNMGLLAGSWPERLWNVLGAARTDGAVCSASGHKALSLHFGESYGLDPEALLKADLFVFWGFNAVASAPHIWNLAQTVRSAGGAPIVVIDPRKSETARRADLWVAPRPGSDVALAFGLLRELIRAGDAPRDFVDRWCRDFGRLADAVAPWTPDRVSSSTGVPEETLHDLVRRYRRHPMGATLIGIGLQKQDHGADAVRAAAFVPTVLGGHRRFFYGNGSAYTVDRSLVRGHRPGERPPVTSQVALADRLEAGAYKFVFVNCHNPAVTLPRAGGVQRGLRREDVYVAVHDTHWSRTARLADAVLPAPSHFEKRDVVIPWGHSHVRLQPKLMDRLTDSRSEVELTAALGRRLGLDDERLYEDPWAVLGRALEGAFEDGDADDLMAGRRLRLRRKPLDRYATPSGRIEFHPDAPAGVSPLPVPEDPRDGPDVFVLLNSALPHYTHTQFQEVYGPIPTRVAIHPEDARSLGIADGAAATLVNDRGALEVLVFSSDAVDRGVLWAPRQSEDARGRPFNGLTDGTPQVLGKGPRFNSTRVRIRVGS